jgi:hypothetical protein
MGGVERHREDMEDEQAYLCADPWPAVTDLSDKRPGRDMAHIAETVRGAEPEPRRGL